MPWPQGPMHRRAQWPGYRPARSGLSTPIVKKLSHRPQVFWNAKKSLCFGPLAALEPHSCDVLTIAYALNRRPSGGCRRSATRDRRSRGTRRLSHAARKLREICSPLTFETVAGLLLASDSRISMRAATSCSGIVPSKERNRRVWIGRGLVGCRWNLGGHRLEPEGATRERLWTRDRDHRSRSRAATFRRWLRGCGDRSPPCLRTMV
jgi:hypothetical protein